jgi:hypothetical protein
MVVAPRQTTWRGGREVLPGSAVPGGSSAARPGRFSRLATGARGLGARALAPIGGPAGLALTGAIVVVPEVARAAQNPRTDRWQLPRSRSDLAQSFRDAADPRTWVGLRDRDPERRLRNFGDDAVGRSARLYRAGDDRGMQRLGDEARRLARDFPQARRELNRFAADQERAAARIQRANRLFGRNRVGPDDIVDPLAATRVARRLERMRGDSARSLSGLRRDSQRNLTLTAQAFESGSKGASEALRRNFDGSIRGVESLMRRGRVSARTGAREIRSNVEAQMQAMASGVMDSSRESQRALTQNLGRGVRAAASEMRRGRGLTDRELRAMRRATEQQTDAMRAGLVGNSRAGRIALARNFAQAADAISSEMREAGRATREGTREIRRLMSASLRELGLSDRQARNVVQVDSRGRVSYGATDSSGGSREGGPNRESGGWFGARGQRGRDADRPNARLGLGEYVLNAPKQGPVEEGLALRAALLGGPASLDELDHDPRMRVPHWAAAPGFLGAFAPGGRAGGRQIVSVPGFPGERAARHILDEIAWVTQRFRGLRLTDAFGPNHRSRGHTVTGTAADFAGPDRLMDRAVAALVRRGYRVLYDGRFGSTRYPGHGPSTVAGGNAHLHVEFGEAMRSIGAPGTALDGDAPQLRRVRVRGVRGQPGRLAQGAVDRVRTAANRRLRTLAAEQGVDPALSDHAGPGGRGALPRSTLRRLIAQALRITGHWPPTPANIDAVLGRVMQESGGNPNAINLWDSNAQAGHPSEGLLQTIPGTFAAHRSRRLPNRIRHPLANLVAGLNYMHRQYGRIVAANGRGYATGGRRGGGARRPRFDLARLRRLLGARRGASPAVLRALGVTPAQARELKIRVVDPVSQASRAATSVVGGVSRFAGLRETRAAELALTDREAGLDEEDLATPGGRADRFDELTEQLTGRVDIAYQAAVEEERYEQAVRHTQHALGRARGQEREIGRTFARRLRGADTRTERRRLASQRDRQLAAARRRVRAYEQQVARRRRQAEEAGRERRGLDLEVRETLDERDALTAPMRVLEGDLELLELRERAGVVSADDARALRQQLRAQALGAKGLSERDRLGILADQRADRDDPLARVQDRLGEIDLQLRAGDFGVDAGAEGRADAARRATLEQTLAAGGLTARETLELRAQLADATKAVEEQKRALQEHTDALKGVQDEMKRSNDIAAGVANVSAREATRMMAELLSGQIGGGAGQRALTPGYGTSWRV